MKQMIGTLFAAVLFGWVVYSISLKRHVSVLNEQPSRYVQHLTPCDG